MHILFVSAEYPPQMGGVGAYTAKLSCALVGLGTRVSVLTSQVNAVAEAVQPDLPEVKLYPEIPKWGPAIWRQVAERAQSIEADWIHVQYQTAAYGMNPAINLAPERWTRSGLRVAWTYHDLLPPYLFPKAGSRLRGWVTQRPAGPSSLCIVTNEADRLSLSERSVQAHAIPIGSNILAVQLESAERASLRGRHGYAAETPVIGFFGFLNRSKGAPTLLRALKQLVDGGIDARLLLIGEGLGTSDPTNRETQAEVRALIEGLEIAQRVSTTGALSDREVAAALNTVDVLVLPFEDGASLRRGTLMAGLANGCAIVTTPPAAAIPALIPGETFLTAPAGDASVFAGQIRRVLSDPGLAERLRAAARQASAHFSWEAIARRHLELYTSASATKASSSSPPLP